MKPEEICEEQVMGSRKHIFPRIDEAINRAEHLGDALKQFI